MLTGMPRVAAPEPVLSEVVRQRLAALLEEIPARRAIGPPPDEGPAPAVPTPAPDAAPDGRRVLAEWGRTAWEFTRSHLVAVGIVLLTGCLWAGYSVLQARSTPVEVAPDTTPSVVASPTPTPTPPTTILVHVLGAVTRPGVVELPEGARVRDAIAAAGGLADDADPAELNLAAILADGTQVVIGDVAEPRGELRGDGGGGSVSGTGGGGRKLSLNSATQAEFETLPGIGPVTAGRIIAWREQHGRFSRIEELQEVDGIGPKTYGQLADLVRL